MNDLPEWQDAELRQHLNWYREVACNRRPAKYLIAASIPVEPELLDSEAAGEPRWQALERATDEFLQLWTNIKAGGPLPQRRPTSLLDLTVVLTQEMLARCNFCRWHCHVDRSTEGKRGACQLAQDTRVSSFFHHRGEEDVLRGNRGSGTIFFTSCNMRCSFCQNGDISTDKDNGLETSPQQLAAMARQLRLEGCHNINWVGGDPTIHLHTIVEAISLMEREPNKSDRLHGLRVKSDFFVSYAERSHEATYQGRFNVPMLWNSNFFMSEPAMKVLRILMDVWLPDFKFSSGKCAVKLSRTPWYWETVTQNIKKIHHWGESYLIRHLIMPNHVDCCTREVLEWVKENVPEAPVNVMDQYHPDNFCDPTSAKFQEKYLELARRCSRQEIQRALQMARELNIRFETITR